MTGDDKIAELLITAGANVNAADENFNTPLHLAANGDSDKHLRVAEMLVNHGANVNAANIANEMPWDVTKTDNYRSKFINPYKYTNRQIDFRNLIIISLSFLNSPFFLIF